MLILCNLLMSDGGGWGVRRWKRVQLKAAVNKYRWLRKLPSVPRAVVLAPVARAGKLGPETTRAFGKMRSGERMSPAAFGWTLFLVLSRTLTS